MCNIISLDIRETKVLSTFKDRQFDYFFNKFIANFDTSRIQTYGSQHALIYIYIHQFSLGPYVIHTSFVRRSFSTFFFFFICVTGQILRPQLQCFSSLFLALNISALPSSAANNFLLCRRWQPTALHSAVAGRQLSLLSKNWRLSMCSLKYDWSRRVARS